MPRYEIKTDRHRLTIRKPWRIDSYGWPVAVALIGLLLWGMGKAFVGEQLWGAGNPLWGAWLLLMLLAFAVSIVFTLNRVLSGGDVIVVDRDLDLVRRNGKPVARLSSISHVATRWTSMKRSNSDTYVFSHRVVLVRENGKPIELDETSYEQDIKSLSLHLRLFQAARRSFPSRS
jgi:hypothetical protein